MQHHKILMGLFTVAMMTSVGAEPAVQAGDTLESLSKVQIRTTISASSAQLSNNKPLEQNMPHAAAQPSAPENSPVNVEEIDAPIIE